MNNWLTPFLNTILLIRKRELHFTLYICLCYVIVATISYLATPICQGSILTLYVSVGWSLDAAVLISMVSVIKTMYYPIIVFPIAVYESVKAYASLKRLALYL